jgi:hypothetical protein
MVMVEISLRFQKAPTKRNPSTSRVSEAANTARRRAEAPWTREKRDREQKTES